MTGRQGRTISGQPARSEEEELKNKRRSRGMQNELAGSKDDGTSNHPETKRTGVNQGSVAGEDRLSGDEGIDVTPLDDRPN